MSQSYWFLVVFVATMVCNGNCRPQKLDDTNVYPVYKTVKQLELETPNRYEKPFKTERNNESVTYLRIDVPYKNEDNLKSSEKLAVNNNSKSIIDYVPVALTIKKSNIKKWPSDQNGIESSDDLSLYNIYTNNINPLYSDHTNNNFDHDFPYIPNSKPSILILEQLTTPKPFQGHLSNVYTQPIHVFDRPVEPPEYPAPESSGVDILHSPYATQPSHTAQNTLFTAVQVFDPTNRPIHEINRPLGTTQNTYPMVPVHVDGIQHPIPLEPSYGDQNGYFPVAQEPSAGFAPTTRPTHNPFPAFSTHVEQPEHPIPTYVEQTTHHFGYVSTTLKPEATTKKRKNTKCPNVSVVATSSVNNNNSINKEGCQDISIHIDTNLNNSNNVVSTKPDPNNSSGVTVQNDQMTQTGIFAIFDILWSIISRFFNFSFSNPILTTIFAPFSAVLAGGMGLSALMFPWAFPHFLFRRTHQRNRFIVFGNRGHKPTKYLYRSIDNNSFYLKRSRRDLEKLQFPYMGWGKRRRISR